MSNSSLYIILSIAGSLASVIGIPLALVSIHQAKAAARRSAQEAEASKNAAQQARDAVEKFKSELRVISDIIDLEKALALMEDIKGFVRTSSLEVVPDRIAGLIVTLNAVRGASLARDTDSQAIIQAAILALRKIENAIALGLLNGTEPKGAATFNRVISRQIDQVQPILIRLKRRIGEQT